MTKPIFVSLGRAGDVLNCLPLARLHFDQTGEKPYFHTASAYADLLDGVSYVDPVIYPGEFSSGILALYQARQLSEDIRLCQIYGFGLNPAQTCSSFARQSWLNAGAKVAWGTLPLVIDQRSPEKEAELINRCVDPTRAKKLVLVALNGQSSPFPYREMITRLLVNRLGSEFQVIDLSKIKADRFYDLLGLFDIAHCLVTIDTGHLHLAHASNVPVVSFITRDPTDWHGSPWRPNHVGRWYYDEVPNVLHRINYAVWFGKEIKQPKIIHAWCDWRDHKPGETLSRMHVAQESWFREYANGYWQPCEHKKTHGTRTGREIGDPHEVSFVKDTIDQAVSKASSDSDIICLTNSDVGFTPDITGHILEVVGRKGAAFSHRRDFPRIETPFISEAQVKLGRWYPGSDLFAFTVGWWKEHREEYGDYLMGREYFDEALRQLIKYHGGGNLPYCVWHESHESLWCGPERKTLPGNVYNRRLIERWFEETGFTHDDYQFFRCAEEHQVPPQTLK
jgi:hypothetical protein